MDKVYISLNLDHHWVAIELNLKDGIISVYDSMKMTIHTRQTTTKLAPITHVLPNVLLSLSRKVKKGPWPINVSPRSPQQEKWVS